MFYEIYNNGVNEIEHYNRANEEAIVVGYLSIAEFEESFNEYGFADSNLADAKIHSNNFRNSIEVYDDYSFGLINVLNLHDVFGPKDRLAFFIKANMFLVIDIEDSDESTRELFKLCINRFKPENTTLEKVIYSFFDGLLYDDNKIMENIEFSISEMEDSVENSHIDKTFISELVDIKKELILIRNYYEQFVTLGEELQENENDLFKEEDLRYFKIFTDKVERLSNNTAMLRDYTVQVRESYDAVLNYNLNNIMKIFTVVATIFMPLTLIVGWYGMNFKYMPELAWKYGYIGVICLSVLSFTLCFVFFKKKKLL